MYYPDLSLYSYSTEFDVDRVLNVGWLDDLHDFPKGIVPASVTLKLKRILLDKRDINKMRGTHMCAFCGAEKVYLEFSDIRRLLGMSEIWIPSHTGIIYVAPTLVYHYIAEHQYKPPQEFLDAVEAYDLRSDWNPEKVYLEILQRHLSER